MFYHVLIFSDPVSFLPDLSFCFCVFISSLCYTLTHLILLFLYTKENKYAIVTLHQNPYSLHYYLSQGWGVWGVLNKVFYGEALPRDSTCSSLDRKGIPFAYFPLQNAVPSTYLLTKRNKSLKACYLYVAPTKL